MSDQRTKKGAEQEIIETKVSVAASALIKKISQEIPLPLGGEFAPQSVGVDAAVRRSAWTVARVPMSLENRSVEIRGPADLQVASAGLSCGADVFVADMEIDPSGSWGAGVRQAVSLASMDRVSGEDGHTVLTIRPRPLLQVDEKFADVAAEVSAGIVDLVLYSVAHQMSADSDSKLFFYLPDVNQRSAAIAWNRVLDLVAESLELSGNQIYVSVEVSSAAGLIKVEEILWELRRYVVALNARYVDDVVGARPTSGAVQLEAGGKISRQELSEIVEICNRRGAQAVCGVRNDIPLRVGNGNVKVSLSRAVPRSRELSRIG